MPVAGAFFTPHPVDAGRNVHRKCRGSFSLRPIPDAPRTLRLRLFNTLSHYWPKYRRLSVLYRLDDRYSATPAGSLGELYLYYSTLPPTITKQSVSIICS